MVIQLFTAFIHILNDKGFRYSKFGSLHVSKILFDLDILLCHFLDSRNEVLKFLAIIKNSCNFGALLSLFILSMLELNELLLSHLLIKLSKFFV